jgi:hypothetical protein
LKVVIVLTVQHGALGLLLEFGERNLRKGCPPFGWWMHIGNRLQLFLQLLAKVIVHFVWTRLDCFVLEEQFLHDERRWLHLQLRRFSLFALFQEFSLVVNRHPLIY